MSISPNDDFQQGINLHQCVHELPWWIEKLRSLGWANRQELVTYFDKDWVRSEPNAPGSFHVCLTRSGEEPLFSERIDRNAFVFQAHGRPLRAVSKLLANACNLAEQPLVICDCGESDRFRLAWNGFEEFVHFVQAGPRHRAANGCEKPSPGQAQTISPHIGAGLSRGLYRVSEKSAESSFLSVNLEFAARFPQGLGGREVTTSVVEIVPLWSELEALKLARLDFLRLSLGGMEGEALHGLGRFTDSLLGLSVDVVFQPYRYNAPTYGDIEGFLRPLGFYLFDLNIERWNRHSIADINVQDSWVGGSGQVVRATALYLRDPISSRLSMDLAAVARLATIADILGCQDFAVELVSKFKLLSFV